MSQEEKYEIVKVKDERDLLNKIKEYEMLYKVTDKRYKVLFQPSLKLKMKLLIYDFKRLLHNLHYYVMVMRKALQKYKKKGGLK